MKQVLLWTLAWTLAGCGYTTGLSLAPGYQSVGIEIFDNDTLEPDLELGLHKALTRAARNMVDGRLSDPATAGLVVRGHVIDFRRRAGLRNRDNVWVESGIMITATAELVDPRREVRIAGPVRASTNVGYTRAVSGSDLEARERALANLAERLVLDLFTAPPRATGSRRVSAPDSTAPTGGVE